MCYSPAPHMPFGVFLWRGTGRQASRAVLLPPVKWAAEGALQHAQLDCLMPLHNSNLLPEGLLALREFKFMLLYATLCYCHPGSIVLALCFVTPPSLSLTRAIVFSCAVLEARDTLVAWQPMVQQGPDPKQGFRRALLATAVRAALWYHETSPLTLSFFLNSKMKPYGTNWVEPGLAEALRLMAAVCHQLTANTEDEAVLTIYWGNQLLYVLWMAIYWEMCCPPGQRLEWIYSLQYQTEAQQNKSNIFATSGKTWRYAQVIWIQFLSFKF